MTSHSEDNNFNVSINNNEWRNSNSLYGKLSFLCNLAGIESVSPTSIWRWVADSRNSGQGIYLRPVYANTRDLM